MPSVPDYGAKPLVNVFLIVRFCTVLAMLVICGILAAAVATIQSGDTPYSAPHELSVTLGIVVFGTLYSLISVAFVYARAEIGLLVMGAIDCILTICFLVFSILLGRPLSYASCMNVGNTDAAASSNTAYTFVNDMGSNLGRNGDTLSVSAWAGSSQTYCYEAKAIWGICIALALLFFCSGFILPSLYFKARKAYGSKPSKV